MNHVVQSGGHVCLLCGGYADMGIIGPLANNEAVSILNDSYLSSNGIIILGNRDYFAYLIGELTIDEIYRGALENETI